MAINRFVVFPAFLSFARRFYSQGSPDYATTVAIKGDFGPLLLITTVIVGKARLRYPRPLLRPVLILNLDPALFSLIIVTDYGDLIII